MKHIHTATIEGFTFKRTSVSRIYTHAIISVYDVAAQRKEVEAGVRYMWKVNLDYVTQMATGGIYVGTFNDGSTYTKVITAERQASAQAELAKGLDGAIAERLAKFDAEPRLMAADGVTAYSHASWTSRLDLALKARKGLDIVVAATVVSK